MIENKIKKFFNKDGFLIDEFAEVIQDYIKRLKDKDVPLDDIIRDCAKNMHYLDNHYTIMKEYYKKELNIVSVLDKNGILIKEIWDTK